MTAESVNDAAERLSRSCLSKKAYRSVAAAENVARVRSEATGERLVSYACPAGHYHVGHER